MDAEHEGRLLQRSRRVRIDPVFFGADPDERDPDVRAAQLHSAALIGGVLWEASVTLIDQLFDDVAMLRVSTSDDWAELIDETAILHRLPRRFWHLLSPGFAARFVAAAIDLTGRVSKGWTPLTCVAQELALKCLLDEMEVHTDTFEVPLPTDWRDDVEQFLFEDLDHEFLYAAAYDGFEHDPTFGPPGMAPMGFNDWFTPFGRDRRSAPFVEEDS